MKLQSVELQMPAADEAAIFLENIWRLIPLGKFGATRYFRGTGDHPYLLSIKDAATPAILSVTLAGTEVELAALYARAQRNNVECTRIAELDAPGGGAGYLVRGPENQTYRFVNPTIVPAVNDNADQPIQITHVVLNVSDLKACEAFALEVLGFQISDRTAAMTFVRCNRKHHCVAYAPNAVPSLNHIAFEMQDIDAVMRGIGRMRDAGFPLAWGPGRHGPGDNVFSYFIAPFGGVIEYTAEISEVDENYKVGSPADWKWPAGRIDQWGLSTKEVALISAAEKTFRFPGS